MLAAVQVSNFVARFTAEVSAPSATTASGSYNSEYILEWGTIGSRDALLVSGYSLEEDIRRSREAGFDHHLVKPVDFDSLLALIGRPR
ncbi:response regulator [Tautonia sociabilis]|uniref:Response regulatory domain-containing protein n=1 Tax=Tautonia sociabilis TaxID=2080755 RepID=A0A432MLD8_9BACT|nr:hypothetical protein [Tautonia sociabilis]RUL88079.1 hypothetical protein TsocGM_09050 [Tautonia sociabilis]